MEATDEAFPRTDPKDIGTIYQMLKVLDMVFTKNQIPYWIDGGTALGCVRHQGIIPWDDDADVVFYAKDMGKVFLLEKEFAAYGFFLHSLLNTTYCFRLQPSKEKKYPFIDIMGYSLFPDGTLRFAFKPFRREFSNFYWLPEEVSPLVRTKFGPITVNAPSSMMRYLYQGYGGDCLFKAVNRNYHGTKNQGVKMDIKDYSPADYEIENFHVSLND